MNMKTIYFIAGLPRSGSTLLCNLLMQNPRFHASGTSGLVEVLRGVRDGWDQVAAFRAMPSAASRAAQLGALRGALFGFYDFVDRPVVFDKSRAWPNYVEMLAALLGDERVKILCCVRDLRDVVASFEKVYRRTLAVGVPMQQREAPEAFATLQGRCDLWVRADQPIGSAYNAVKDALARGHREKLHFVRYEELTAQPAATMAGIYAFLGEDGFTHDFENVEQVIAEDDRVHGFEGLHVIRSSVRAQRAQWPQVLGPLGERYRGEGW
jgi:sulfotransferase